MGWGRAWRRRAAILATVGILVAAPVFGQQTQSGPGGPPPAAAAPPSLPPAVTAGAELSNHLTTLEAQIASLVQQRGDSPAQNVLIDLQIDLRIVCRHIVLAAQHADENSPEQMAMRLRINDLTQTIAMVDSLVQRSSVAPGPREIAAYKALHDATYSLPQIKSIDDLDALTKQYGVLLGAIFDSSHAPLPVMRPSRPATPATNLSSSAISIPDLADQAAHVEVPAPLHRLLAALGAAARAPDAGEGPNSPPGVLAFVVSLLQSLQSNPLLGDPARQQIEQQLSDALALYVDPRTRGAGLPRLAALSPYRQSLGDAAGADALQLKPAFNWAQQNGDSGTPVITAIYSYLDVSRRFTDRPADSNLSGSLKHASDAIKQQFASEKAQFLTDASAVATGGGASEAPDMSSQANLMNQAIDTLDLIDAQPAAQAAIAPFRPRPYGALAMKVNQAAAAISAPATAQASRDQAIALLRDLKDLGDAANALSDPNGSAEIPSSVAAAYIGQSRDSFDKTWKQLVGDLASDLSAGQPLDQKKLQELKIARKLQAALGEAADAEAVIADLSTLRKWVDVAFTPEDLSAVLGPYRDATTAAFAAVGGDDPEPMKQWSRMHDDYLPLLRMLSDTANQRQACAALPDSIIGAAGRLATPLNVTLFSGQRAASVLIPQWAQCLQAADAADADQASHQLMDELRKHMHHDRK